MKRITLSLVMIALAITVLAQTPQALKYQAVARDNAGNVLVNQNVTFRFSILQGSASGTLIFSETHEAITNEFGLVNLEIGTGEPEIGFLSEIDWSTGEKFLEVELDPAGGYTFTSMGTTQLVSVPYALYSESTGDTSLWGKNNDDLYYNKGNVGVGIDSPAQLLSANGIIESMTEGFMFPDGSVQTTAAPSSPGGSSDTIAFGGPPTAAEERGYIGMLVDGVPGSWEWGLGCEDCSAVFDMEWSMYWPYDGGFTGPKQHNVLTIYKNIDKASVLLIQRLVTSTVIPDVQFRFYRFNPDISNFEIYYTITLEAAVIVDFHHDVYHAGNGVMAHMDKISFGYQTIIWEWLDGGIQYQDDVWPTD